MNEWQLPSSKVHEVWDEIHNGNDNLLGSGTSEDTDHSLVDMYSNWKMVQVLEFLDITGIVK